MDKQSANAGKQHPPRGQMVDMGGYRLHLHCQGSGSPTVILEAAIWDFSLTWALVQPEVARFTRVCAYDRGGLGWSDPSPRPRTAEAMCAELHDLLWRANVPGPYVLVGQSFSGLLVRLFAHQYPKEVAGMVLVDAAHEDQYRRFPEPIRNLGITEQQLQFLRQQRAAVETQGPTPPLLPMPPQMPADVAEMYQALAMNDAPRLDTMIGELASLEISQAQVRAMPTKSLGNIPLVALSHGQAQPVPGMPDEVNRAYEATWQEMQAEMAALSANGTRIVAQQSGHMIHYDQPELVVEAIRQVVAAVRGETG